MSTLYSTINKKSYCTKQTEQDDLKGEIDSLITVSLCKLFRARGNGIWKLKMLDKSRYASSVAP